MVRQKNCFLAIYPPVSTINDYGEGGLKMIDLESMVKALRLAWLKRIFNANDGTWKRYLQHQLKTFGGLFFLNCNYDVNDYTITSQFYRELLLWWSQFRETFATDLNWTNIIWNNKEIRIDKKPIYYKKYFDSGITHIHDLRFDLNINDSFSYVLNKISKISFLQWAGLRHSIPDFLKGDRNYIYTLTLSSLQINNNIFDAKRKKSRDYYSLLVMKKSQPPNIVHKWKSDFNISDDLLRESFILPHSVALESYVKAFQYKILNNILYTNTKLCKIGFRADDLCTFCEAERETLYHLLYQCTYARQFWNDFELCWFRLSNQVVHLTLENVLFGMLSTQCPSHTLLNYFIIIGKLFLWDCRRKQIHPKIQGYQNKIAIKYEIERKINKKNFFEKKWIFK